MKKLSSMDLIPFDAPIYIYGSGKLGIRLKNDIAKQRKDIQILGFLDSFENGMVEGLPKICIRDFDWQKRVFHRIIIASAFSIEIAHTLDKLKIQNYLILEDMQSFFNISVCKYLFSIYDLPGKSRPVILGDFDFCRTVSIWLKTYRKDIPECLIVTDKEKSMRIRETGVHDYLVLSEDAFLEFEFDSYMKSRAKILKLSTVCEPHLCRDPVIVYQIGKVGSTTVYESLLPLFGISCVFHTHTLDPAVLRNAAMNCLGNLDLVKMYSQSLNLFYNLRKFRHVRVITLVRDYIGRYISNFFHHIETLHPHYIREDGTLKKEEILSYLVTQSTMFKSDIHDVFRNWFEREFETILGVSIFDHPFDQEKGFSVIHNKNTSVLVLTLETLNKNFFQIGKFLHYNGKIEMIKSNIGLKKKYSKEYQYISVVSG